MENTEQEYDMSIHHNPSASAWAKFFMEIWEKLGKPELTEDYMLGWFANAMMAMHDYVLIEQFDPSEYIVEDQLILDPPNYKGEI